MPAPEQGNSTVKKADIEKVVSVWTGIPIQLTEDESAEMLKLEDRIHRLIWQCCCQKQSNESVVAQQTRPDAVF